MKDRYNLSDDPELKALVMIYVWRKNPALTEEKGARGLRPGREPIRRDAGRVRRVGPVRVGRSGELKAAGPGRTGGVVAIAGKH